MKRSLLVAAALAACGPAAYAQTVTVYGIVDVAVEHLSNVAPSGKSLTRMPGLTGSVPSRLGFRGTEDLGDGLKALFTLEMGMSMDSGVLNQGGRGWGRQAFVGLSGGWGTVTLGRQYTMVFLGNGDADVMGPNTIGISSLDNYFPNARYDNSIAYRGTFSGLTIGAMYSLGRDAVNAGPSPAGTNCGGENAADKKACLGTSFMLKYDSPTWGAALASDSNRGGAGAFAGLTTSDRKDTRTLFNGYVRFSGIKVGGGYMTRKNDGSATTPKSELTYLGLSYPATPQVTLDAQLSQLKFKSSPNKATLIAARASYGFSRRTTVYASLGQMDNSGTLAQSVSGAAAGGTPAGGESQSGLAVGIRHVF